MVAKAASSKNITFTFEITDPPEQKHVLIKNISNPGSGLGNSSFYLPGFLRSPKSMLSWVMALKSYVIMRIESVTVDKAYVIMRIENATVDRSYVIMRIDKVTVGKSYVIMRIEHVTVDKSYVTMKFENVTVDTAYVIVRFGNVRSTSHTL